MERIREQAGNRTRNRKRIPVLAVLLLMLVCVFAPRAQAAAAIKGIDVSRWQGTVNWTKVKDSGVRYVMLGIGRLEGNTRTVDPTFEYNIKNALANDIHVGVYLYSKATTVAQAKKEAQFVLDTIEGYQITYPVAFDMEDTVHLKLTRKRRTDIAIAFMQVIEDAGYYPMIYASENWYTERMDMTRLKKYDKWVANWHAKPTTSGMGMWQYSSTGKVSGISAAVDLDYSYKDYSKVVTPRTVAKDKENRKTGWISSNGKYSYIQKDGSKARSKFLTISGKKYYFNANGCRVTGWQSINGKKYYFNSKGVMQTGWLAYKGKTYYLSTQTGQMRTGWLTFDDGKYYMNKDGTRRTGWLTLDGKTYFLNLKTGKMRTGWLTYQGKTYYFSTQTGQMRYGWLTFGDKKYYMRKNGTRASGWTKLSGKWYYFNKTDGVMKKNCKVGKYVFAANGVCSNYK